METLLPSERIKFNIYSSFLLKSNDKQNLTAVPESEITFRHFEDSLALLKVIDFREKSVIDIGSGAGFPGIPLKITTPTLSLTLIDAQQKRAKFLRELLNLLELDATVIHTRAEELSQNELHRDKYDIAVSRAVAKLNILSELCMPFVKLNGYFLAHKGAELESEISEAGNAVTKLGGTIERVEPYFHGSIVVIRKTSPTPQQFPRRWKKIENNPL